MFARTGVASWVGRRAATDPHHLSRGDQPSDRARVVRLHARGEQLTFPQLGGAGHTVQLPSGVRRGVVAVEPRGWGDVLPAEHESRESLEVHRLDLLARLRQLAPPRALQQTTRAPAVRRAAAERSAHESAGARPFVESFTDPVRIERVPSEDVGDRDHAGK